VVKVIKVGDTVQVRPAFGAQPAVAARVLQLEVVEAGEKEGGVQVNAFALCEKTAPHLVVVYSTGIPPCPTRWAYGTQVVL